MCFPNDMANMADDGNDIAIIGFASGAVVVLLLVAGYCFIVALVYWKRRARYVLISSLIVLLL